MVSLPGETITVFETLVGVVVYKRFVLGLPRAF